MKLDEQYLDVLQNIESAVVSVYRNQPALLDLEVIEAFDGLIRAYAWEQETRGIPYLRLSDRAQEVYEHTRRMCEWRLGRQSVDLPRLDQGNSGPAPITVPEVLLCLKHIRKSIRYWNKENGRQGYLTYVNQFF